MKAIFLSDVKIGYISSMTYSCGWKDFFLLNDSFYRTSAICVSHVCKKVMTVYTVLMWTLSKCINTIQ